MLHTKFNEIDYLKYNRFFAIGCSFTNWHWPTWANIIAEQFPHMQFHNFGMPGASNQYISTVLSQLQRGYKLCDTDLVGIMWSTFHRHIAYRSHDDIKEQIAKPIDYFVCPHPGNWKALGDMVHVQQIDSDVCWDDRGFAIRDCAIIDNTTSVLKSAEYDAFQMMSLTPENQILYDRSIIDTHKQDVYDLYSDLSDNMISGNNDIINTLGWHLDHVTVEWEKPWTPIGSGDLDPDRHPSSSSWCEFLQQSGFKATKKTVQTCAQRDQAVQTVGHCGKFPDSWTYQAMIKSELPL